MAMDSGLSQAPVIGPRVRADTLGLPRNDRVKNKNAPETGGVLLSGLGRLSPS
jgi:hypothetical protein